MGRDRNFVGWFLCILAVGFATLLRAQQDLPSEILAYADVTLYNGKILTADERFTVASAMAVRDGKVLAVGDDARILKMAGPRTEKIDLQGKNVVPGFVEVHSGNYEGWHGPNGPSYYPSTSLKFLDLDAGLRAMKEVIEKAKPGEWVFMRAFRSEAAYRLTRQLLDPISLNNPVLVTLDNTAGIVNTLAFQKLPKWPELQPSIFKDEKGVPTGMIKNWAYGVLTYEILPWPEGQFWNDLVQSQLRMMRRLNELGVTTMGGRAGGLSVSIVKELYDKGQLPVRVRIISEVARVNPNTDGMLRRLGNLQGIGDEWFRISGMTVSSVDSNLDNGGFLTRKAKIRMYPGDAYGPYGQNKWADGVDKGYDWKEYSDYKSSLLSARYGWSISDMHIQGDGGIDLLLNTMKAAEALYPGKVKRWGAVHGMMRTPDQLRELAKYDSQLSYGSYLFLGRSSGEQGTYQYGADEVNNMLALKSAINAGLKPILEARTGLPSYYRSFDRSLDLTKGERPGSDTAGYVGPGLTPDEEDEFERYKSTYFLKIEKTITRENEMTGRIWGPQEKVSRQEALWMITNWAARMYKTENEIGSLEPGKLADFLVIGADYLTVPEKEISEIPILKVFVGGKVHYEKR